jgi:hypothetical protein
MLAYLFSPSLVMMPSSYVNLLAFTMNSHDAIAMVKTSKLTHGDGIMTSHGENK